MNFQLTLAQQLELEKVVRTVDTMTSRDIEVAKDMLKDQTKQIFYYRNLANQLMKKEISSLAKDMEESLQQSSSL